MFLALLLSGFFMRRRWWIKALLPVFMLPWALPAIPAYVSFHWMLIGEEGLINSLLALLGIQGRSGFRTAGSRSRRISPPTSGSGCRSGR
jgi:ABC-type sugar transport system permease subunit